MLPNSKVAFFLIDYSITGGVEKVVADLSHVFDKRGFNETHLISLSSSNSEPEIDFNQNLKIHILNKKKNDFSEKLSSILKENTISNLIFQGDNMTISLNVLNACKMSNCNPILHYHGSPYAYLRKYIFLDDIKRNPLLVFKLLWSGIVYPFKKQKLKKVIKNTTGSFVCVSNGSENELKELFKLPKNISDKIITIHNPIAIKQPENDGKKNKQNFVSYVARLTEKHKNSFLAVETWGKIATNHPDWTLQVIGDGPLRKKMQQYLEHNNIKNAVFTGMVKNVSEYLKRSRIAINTSNCEGFGLAMAEAGYYKNALVSTRSDGGIIDIVNNETGILVPKNDSSKMAEAISSLLLNPSLRDTYAENAHKRIMDLTNEQNLEKWFSILKND